MIIGITIAFSMNKCADNIKDNKLKILYLTNIKSDIEADKIQLQKNIEAIDNKLAICSKIIPMSNSETDQDMKLMYNIFEIVKYKNFSPKSITYKTLINSDDLKLIENFKLKQRFISSILITMK